MAQLMRPPVALLVVSMDTKPAPGLFSPVLISATMTGNSTLADPQQAISGRKPSNNPKQGLVFCDPNQGRVVDCQSCAASKRSRKSFTTVCAKAFDIKLYTKENTTLTKTLQPPDNSTISKRVLKSGCFMSHQANFHPERHPGGHRTIELSEGGARLKNTPNAGGNSITSEVMSFELLRRLIGARLAKTEMEIRYDFPDHSKKTDYVVSIDTDTGAQREVAVSVTRAMRHPGKEYEYKQAARLINKKLLCVYFSSRNVLKPHRWAQQVLHILTDDARKARLLRRAFKRADPDLKQGVVVICTVTKNARFLYVRDEYMSAVESDSDYDDDHGEHMIYVPARYCTQADTQW